MSAVLTAASRRADVLQQCERAVIGGLLLDNSSIVRVNVTASDFTNVAYGEIFDMIRRTIDERIVAEPVMIANRLQAESRKSNWLPVVSQIVIDTASAANVHVYADRIRQASMARRAIEIGQFMIDNVDDDPPKAIEQAVRELLALNTVAKDWSCHQSEAMKSAIDYMAQAVDGFLGVGYGLRDLDDKLGGMQGGDLVVVGARPAMGKTAFMLNMAARCKVGVGLISGEQNRGQIGMRVMSINGSLALHKMRKGKLDDSEWARVSEVMANLKNEPVWVYDKPGPTIDDIKRQARQWRFDKGIGLLIVDYLQKIRGGEGREKRDQVGSIAAELKNLARELEIPVVPLAQVNRDVEKNPLGEDGMGRCPFMSDLAESGVIEMEADTIMTLYRPGVYLPKDERFKGRAVVNVCKSRHGPVGKIDVSWRGEFLQFGDLASMERYE